MCPATAGQKADEDFRKAEFDLRAIGCDAVVTGEGKLKATPKRETFKRDSDRFGFFAFALNLTIRVAACL